MATRIHVGKAVDFNITDFRDAGGNPTTVDTTTQPARVEITGGLTVENPSADGLSGSLRAGGAPGTAQVTVFVDVREGEEIKELPVTADFEIVAGEASTATFNTGPEHD
jgi:hypothetical protein